MNIKLVLFSLIIASLYPLGNLNASEGNLYECKFDTFIRSTYNKITNETQEGKIVFFWDNNEIKFTKSSSVFPDFSFTVVSLDEHGFVSNSYGKSTIVSLNNNFLTITTNTGISGSIINSICKIV